MFRRRNGKIPVIDLLRSNRRVLQRKIEGWTGTRRLVVSDLLDNIDHRSRTLRLAFKKGEEGDKLLDLATFATKLVTNYALTGWYLP